MGNMAVAMFSKFKTRLEKLEKKIDISDELIDVFGCKLTRAQLGEIMKEVLENNDGRYAGLPIISADGWGVIEKPIKNTVLCYPTIG